MRDRWSGDDDLRQRFVKLAAEEYGRVFDALPDNSYVTYGNVDIPDLMRSYLRPGITFVDGDVIDLDGERWGIVGGGLRTPLGIPGEVDEKEYDAKLDALGPVDVVCTHQPPRIPWLVYDVLGRRFEPGSTGLISYIQRHQPERSYFGHVHQPLASRGVIGRTELINVGHFRGTGRPWVHDTA
jgi:Icc-related predicted phosphoesterase